MKKVLAVLVVFLATGLLVNSMIMTYYLTRINNGLQENLTSIEQLGQYQNSIIEKNNDLQDMLVTVGSIDKGMDGTIAQTATLLSLLSQVVDLNGQSLQLNRDMETISQQSGATIAQVHTHVDSLKPQSVLMKQYLEQLKRLAESDAENLESIRRSTEQMNRKLPGVM